MIAEKYEDCPNGCDAASWAYDGQTCRACGWSAFAGLKKAKARRAPAEPAPMEMDEPVAWLRIRSDGRRTFWETNVDGDCTPLYRRPQPAEGWREALALIRHFADAINERNYADKRLYLLQHIDRLLAASPPVSASPDEGEQQ